MPTIQKAGAIVLSQKNPSRVAVLFRSKHDDWSFPKGHIEEGETAMEGMRREVLEETGLPVRLLEALPALEYDHPKGDHVVVHMFLMQSENDAALKTEHEGDKVAWIEYVKVRDLLSYDNIKTYYASVFARIERSIEELGSSSGRGR